MSDYIEDRLRANKFNPQAISILSEVFKDNSIKVADMEDDEQRNTDFISVATGKRYCCRIFRYNQLEKYLVNFTFRYWRASGRKTEYKKLIEGLGDFYIQGLANELDDKIELWRVLNLDVFRKWSDDYKLKHDGDYGGIIIPCGDGKSSFIKFDVKNIPNIVEATNIKEINE
jgi:hypothetical protein